MSKVARLLRFAPFSMLIFNTCENGILVSMATCTHRAEQRELHFRQDRF